MTTRPPIAPIEIFRAGTFADMSGREHTLTVADLQEIADSYDPAKGEAPLTIGHPQTDGPAYGWAKALRVEGDVLLAEPHQVESAFADAVNNGRYKKRSVALYPRTARNNPVPGKLYLRHIGFLGASVPAVTGLRDVTFAAGEEFLELQFSGPSRWSWRTLVQILSRLRDRAIADEGLDKANELIPAYELDALREAAQFDEDGDRYAAPPVSPTREDPAVTQTTQADLDAQKRELDERAERLAADERAANERRAAAQRDEAAAFADGLIQDGRLAPKHKASVVELLVALPTAEPLSFADGGTTVTKPADELLRELLSSAPKQIDFSEKARVEAAPTFAFAAPAGALVDADRLELLQRAEAYQAQHPGTSLATAIKAVGGR